MVRSTHFLILVVALVALFGAFHPVLDAAGFCGSGGCPEAMESSSGANAGFSLSCIAVVGPASGVLAFAFAALFLGRGRSGGTKPYELRLAPDLPPPQ